MNTEVARKEASSVGRCCLVLQLIEDLSDREMKRFL